MKEYWGLDLFCCAGGAARGYQNAGFKMRGVDHKHQKRYVGEQFIQGDALQYLSDLIDSGEIEQFDFIHASPPCQANTTLRSLHKHKHYEDLIPRTRELLIRSGKPWVMENVVGAKLIYPLMLCGSMFGLKTDCLAELQRHRLFEVSGFYMLTPNCNHGFAGVPGVYGGHARDRRRVLGVYGEAHREAKRERVINVVGHTADSRKVISVNGHTPVGPRSQANREVISIAGERAFKPPAMEKRKTISITGSTPQQNVVRNTVRKTYSIKDAQTAMGIDWMTMAELSQAIPPAYTEFIGKQLVQMLRDRE